MLATSVRRSGVGELLRVPLSGRPSANDLQAFFDLLKTEAQARRGPLSLLIDACGLDFAAFRLEHAQVARRALVVLGPTLAGRYLAEAFVHERRTIRMLVATNQRLFGMADTHRTFATVREAERWLSRV